MAFDSAIAFGLWFTVLFANFAEAMAEARGKAQADALRKTKTDVVAKRLNSAGKMEQVSGSMLRIGDVVVCDANDLIPGDGEVIEPDNDVVAIGSGGQYAMAAAQALMRHTTLSAAELARAAMEVAASICIYTNDNITLHCVDGTQPAEAAKGGTSD